MLKKLNSNQLKIIAVCAMIFDHLLWVLKPGYDNGAVFVLLHLVGRIVAPIFCYFIAEGAFYTKNRKKYLLRLLLFALLSHFAYCFAFGINFIPFLNGSIFNQTSIMWPLALGLVGIMIQDTKMKNIYKVLLTILLCVLAFPADWSSVAVMIIVYNYAYRDSFKKQMISMMIFTAMYAIIYAIFINVWYGLIQMGTVFAIPLLKMYNGERGNWKGMKYFFYIIYPLHLVLCGIIRLCLYGNIPVLVG